jgi:hypothetical protein
LLGGGIGLLEGGALGGIRFGSLRDAAERQHRYGQQQQRDAPR